ncbi:hypothetical protein NBRC10512_002575 [Rhodotorula toruloides]|nr:uncharacterized protein RHTO_00325 [Rhodotorula toruloides NP11]EMS25897.1 hypothetical protein RHTO_00325 [Rhodotorula toruloides NP11]
MFSTPEWPSNALPWRDVPKLMRTRSQASQSALDVEPVLSQVASSPRDVDWSSPTSPSSRLTLIMAGSHIDLRKRNQAFQSKVGKVNKLKQPDPLERKALPRWIIWLFLFLIVGGFGLELLQQIYNFFSRLR